MTTAQIVCLVSGVISALFFNMFKNEVKNDKPDQPFEPHDSAQVAIIAFFVFIGSLVISIGELIAKF